MKHLVVDGDSVYEIDERCMKEKEKQKQEEQSRLSGSKNLLFPPKEGILNKNVVEKSVIEKNSIQK